MGGVSGQEDGEGEVQCGTLLGEELRSLLAAISDVRAAQYMKEFAALVVVE